MGLDLRLYPVHAWQEHGAHSGPQHTPLWGFSHAILDVGRAGTHAVQYALEHGRLVATPLPRGHDFSAYNAHRIPDGECMDEKCYGTLGTDAYGSLYTWVRAGKLADILGPVGGKSAPAAAYLRALEPDARVILDWH